MRYRAELLLTDLYYQTNRYSLVDGFFEGRDEVPDLFRVMDEFAETVPYQIVWTENVNSIRVPFLPSEDPSFLPHIEFSIDGKVMEAYLDTGADELSLTQEQARDLGISAGLELSGVYAGGKEASSYHTILDEVAIGSVILKNVPASINAESSACIGTAVLRQFIPTLDYQQRVLVLRGKDENALGEITESHGNRLTEVPFGFLGSHYLFVQGQINDQGLLHFLLDSGLEDSSSFACPDVTLEYLSIDEPFRLPVLGEGGSGRELYWVGSFDIERIDIGGLVQEDHTGICGIFPDSLYFAEEKLGFIVDGLISHSFLNQYVWTIDFENRIMYFSL